MDTHAFTLWHRPGRRKPWRPVGTADTHAAAVALIGAGGLRGGDWLILAGGDRPSGRAPGRSK